MPYNRKYAKKSVPRKRTYRRRRPAARRAAHRTPFYRTAMPNSMNFRLHFTRTVQMETPGSGAGPDSIMFYPNSILDCTSQAGSQQPYLRDQLFTLYGQCRVLRWSIFIKVLALNVSYPMEIVLSPARDGTPDTDVDLAKTRKFSKSCLALSGQTKYMKLQMTPDQFFGNARGTALRDINNVQTLSTDLTSDYKNPVQLLAYDTSQTLTAGAPIVVVQYHINAWCRFESQLDQVAS